MAKLKTTYICQQCGYESPKWLGKCPACNEWNTIQEELIAAKKTSAANQPVRNSTTVKPVLLDEVTTENYPRIDTRINELNRVLGGGLVPGSMTLIGGEPGIGKSTLALQIGLLSHSKILYISGEESAQQIKYRAERIKKQNKNLQILIETNLENILGALENEKPPCIIIDSVQTLQTDMIESSPGTVSQVRECTNRLIQATKQKNIATFLIGHITKDGSLAGPKILEHMVDTVLQFEGDQNHLYRILRPLKNRFGSTSELGIFEMRQDGLHEVPNPSEVLLNNMHDDLTGMDIASTVDGVRPFLVEIQSLVSTAAYGTPQRSATGFDARRLNMLLAVLEKKVGFKLSVKDVFLNIAGGLKIIDPGIDLAVVVAVMSSNLDMPVTKNTGFAGEIGLSGETRPVIRIEQRIKEAEKLGFTQFFLAKKHEKQLHLKGLSMQLIFVSKVEEVIRKLFASG
ncbi:MAG: DNA repair protein RadA [Bacteroidota bacterium]